MVKNNKNNKKNLQDQIVKLNNEIEELRLEREESKKNVLHFMKEADTARHELTMTKQLIKELKQQHGYTTPPLSSSASSSVSASDEGEEEEEEEEEEEDDDDDDDENDDENDKISLLLLNKSDQTSSLNFIISTNEEKKLNDRTTIPTNDLTEQQLEQIQSKLNQFQVENAELEDELDQIRHEYQATRQALHIENERAETIEIRWKESENNLEQAEITIQELNDDLEKYRQLEWSMKLTNKEQEDTIKQNEIDSWKTKFKDVLDKTEKKDQQLVELEHVVAEWKEKYDKLYHERSMLEDQKVEIDQAKIKENHLKTVNRSLRDELRKLTKAQENSTNIAYLRNVTINFLEKKKQRTQLIPILSTLLQCEKEDKERLYRLTKVKALIKEHS